MAVNAQRDNNTLNAPREISRRDFMRKLAVGSAVAATAGTLPGILAAQEISSSDLLSKIRGYSWYNDLRSRIEAERLDGSISKNVRVIVAHYISESRGYDIDRYDDSNSTHRQTLYDFLEDSEIQAQLNRMTVDDFFVTQDTPEPQDGNEAVVTQDPVTSTPIQPSIAPEIENIGELRNIINKLISEHPTLSVVGPLGIMTTYFALQTVFARNRENKLEWIIENQKQLEKTKKYHKKTAAIPKDMSRSDLESQLSDSLTTISDLETEIIKLQDDLTQLNNTLGIQGNTSQSQGNQKSSIQDIQDRLNEIQQELAQAFAEKDAAETALQNTLDTEEARFSSLEAERSAARDELAAYEAQIGLLEGGAEAMAYFGDFAAKMRPWIDKFEADGMPFGKGVMLTEDQAKTLLNETKTLLRKVGLLIPEDQHAAWLTIPIEWLDKGEASLEEGNLRNGHDTIRSAYAALKFIQELNSGGGEGEYSEADTGLDQYRTEFSNITISSQEIQVALGAGIGNIGDLVDIFTLFEVEYGTSFEDMEKACKKQFRTLTHKFHTDGKGFSDDEKQLHDDCMKIVSACKEIYKDGEKFSIYTQVLPFFYPNKYGQN